MAHQVDLVDIVIDKRDVVLVGLRIHVAGWRIIGDDGVRIQQLKTLAALRDSGALSEQEFEAEKRRLLDS